jgi:hypothetical protein
MYLLQSMILVRARMDELTRPCEPPLTSESPGKSRSALRIKLDVRRARRENPAG